LTNLRGLRTLTDDWINYIREKQFDAIIPGSDYDLIPLAGAKPWLKAEDVNVLVSDLDLVQACYDKSLTTKLLRENNLPYPQFQALNYPHIVKPKHGSGSVGMRIVRNSEDKRIAFNELGDNYFQQEYLGGPEYTCSVFCDKDGEVIQTFMLERDLWYGVTKYAKVCFIREVDELLRNIGAKLRPTGPLNVQLRMTERGPIPFELNCRCSGTTAIRAYYGYNEPDMMIRHFVLGRDITCDPKRAGEAYRYWNEYFEGERRISAWV
ncbi:MAG: ATP-grasp domain-containing protein, partial [Dehalococcoidia bacterium]